jgi:hypothetical protein
VDSDAAALKGPTALPCTSTARANRTRPGAEMGGGTEAIDEARRGRKGVVPGVHLPNRC